MFVSKRSNRWAFVLLFLISLLIDQSSQSIQASDERQSHHNDAKDSETKIDHQHHHQHRHHQQQQQREQIYDTHSGSIHLVDGDQIDHHPSHHHRRSLDNFVLPGSGQLINLDSIKHQSEQSSLPIVSNQIAKRQVHNNPNYQYYSFELPNNTNSFVSFF